MPQKLEVRHVRERPFNWKREGGGFMVFFQKNILILVEEKKSDSEYLSYNLMLNSGRKIRTLRDKKKYSNSCCPKNKF